MRKEDKIRFLLLKEEPNYLKNILSCEKFLEELFTNKNNRIYVAVSGGKDSMVMLDLTLRIWIKYPEICFFVWHWDYGKQLMPRKIEIETLTNIKQLLNRYNFPTENFLIDKRSKEHSSREDSSFGYKVFFLAIKQIIEKYGFTHSLIGLRKEESYERKLMLEKGLVHKRIISSNKIIHDCYPLADFSSNHIWSYIVSNNIPYPSPYDFLAKFRPYETIRFVTFFDNEFNNIDQSDDFFFWREKQ